MTKMIRKKNAFTLVELLVVIAIIALLVSILLPALSTAREQAKRVVCATQLRELGMLLEQYCADHNEFYPPSYTPNYPYCADSRGPLALLGALAYLYDGYNFERLRSDDRNEKMKIFFCPSGIVEYEPEAWRHSAFGMFGYNSYFSFSQGANAIIGNKSFAHGPQNWKALHSPLKRSSPSHWLTVTDISIWGYPGAYQYDNEPFWRSNHPSTIKRSGAGGTLTEHFADGMNGLYVDGGVRWTATNGDFENLVRIENPYLALQQPTSWLFPRTD
jgi:prepilin-type N-terminal cleavage/methylation domain-containing protein